MTKYEKFKISLLGIFTIGILFCFYQYSENGRYEFHKERFFVIDTRTGDVFIIGKKEKVEIENFKLAK